MDTARFANFVLHHRTRRLTQDSVDVRIGARAFDLLELLVSHRDRVVSRDEIMEVVWPGAIVGDNNVNVQVANLRRVLGVGSVVTVSGRGLRFGLDVALDAPLQPVGLQERPSVAVLPFAVLGEDPELDWLADGFVEDITTELSRFHDLFVVARNSAFAYRDRPCDVRTISNELGVRYVVEGSVRATSDRVRVTAQLIDATSGGHVWAENFDRPMAEHFATQAIVARAIVTSLAPQIDRAEAERTRIMVPADLTAHGLARRAWAVISSGEMAYDRRPRDHAETLARQALAIDPNSGLACRVLAWVAWWNVYHGTTTSVPATLVEGKSAATQAIGIDPNDHHARRLRAQLHFMDQNAEAGLPELRKAHELNPNCAVTLAWLGLYESINGNPAKGVPLAEAALLRSPLDPALGSMLCALGFAQFAARDYAAAARTSEAALAEASLSATPLVLGAIAWVGAGRIDRATTTFNNLVEIAPKLAEARLAGRWLTSNPDYLSRAHLFFRIAAGQASPEAADAAR
jgi:TolB-like protein